MAKYDVETFLDAALVLIQANLETRIEAIDLEKGDNLGTPLIPSTSYFDSIANQTINKDNFIYYGINEVKTGAGEGPVSELDISLFFDVVMFNDNGSKEMASTRKALRYNRALREIIEENQTSFRVSRLKVVDLTPMNVKLNDDDGEIYKVSGIVLKATLVG